MYTQNGDTLIPVVETAYEEIATGLQENEENCYFYFFALYPSIYFGFSDDQIDSHSLQEDLENASPWGICSENLAYITAWLTDCEETYAYDWFTDMYASMGETDLYGITDYIEIGIFNDETIQEMIDGNGFGATASSENYPQYITYQLQLCENTSDSDTIKTWRNILI